MAVTVLVPTPLQKYTDNQATIKCVASDVGQLIESLEKNCPGIKARLCDEAGKPRRFLNFYVNQVICVALRVRFRTLFSILVKFSKILG